MVQLVRLLYPARHGMVTEIVVLSHEVAVLCCCNQSTRRVSDRPVAMKGSTRITVVRLQPSIGLMSREGTRLYGPLGCRPRFRRG